MDGYRGRDYFTKEEFEDGCAFNFWFGAVMGIVGFIAIGGTAVLTYMWANNII